jgi:hypothetical protein
VSDLVTGRARVAPVGRTGAMTRLPLKSPICLKNSCHSGISPIFNPPAFVSVIKGISCGQSAIFGGHTPILRGTPTRPLASGPGSGLCAFPTVSPRLPALPACNRH